MSIRHQLESRRLWIVARPINCSEDVGIKDPCPYCNQVHLRLGYCQALDPINADKYPHMHGETLSVTSPSGSVTHDEVSVTPDDGVSVTCETCGEAFTSKRATAKFCTATCRQRARRRHASG